MIADRYSHRGGIQFLYGEGDVTPVGAANGVPQPHPHLLAHLFQITIFTWEYLGSREDFRYWDAHKTPRSLNPPNTVHHRTLVPHGTHRYLPTGPRNETPAKPTTATIIGTAVRLRTTFHTSV